MDFSIVVREREGLRTLHFESESVQGAMRIGHPWELALEYTRAMMACLLLRKGGCKAAGYPPASPSRGLRKGGDFPRRVLLIGLGAGSQAKFLYRHCPAARLTVVEIAPQVVAAARECFELPDDPARMEIVIGDGAEYVRTADKTFDLIMVDGFNERGDAGALNKLPFYRACRSRLSEQGLLAVNLIGLSAGYKGGFVHIDEAFDHRAVLFPRCKSGNTIAFAATGEAIDLALDELKERARAFEAHAGLALEPIISRLGDESAPGGRLRI